jgi:protein-tyrosine phosphatase
MDSPTLLFVCTGNVCRSPMAEHLLRALMGPEPDWSIRSAGLQAGSGLPISTSARAALTQRGIDAGDHRSRPLTEALVDEATLIVVMTAAQRSEMQSRFPEHADKVYLLRSFAAAVEDEDIDDPIGATVDTYRRTRDEIAAALPGLLRFMRAVQARRSPGP